MESYTQIADNLRACGIRTDWCDKIQAAEDAFNALESIATRCERAPENLHEKQVQRYSSWAGEIASQAISTVLNPA